MFPLPIRLRLRSDMLVRYASVALWTLLAAAWLASCAPALAPRADMGRLPSPVTNNAVAYVPAGANGGTLYSFLGLGAGKTHADIVRSAFACSEFSLTCRRLPDVPVDEGRLAASAATVAGKIYIFGGYTVAADGAEHSTPDVFRFDPATERYERMADMPTPVDDATAIAMFERYIYVVSGWHDIGNVSLVQVYDTAQDQWFRASEFPGAPVFGHAGGAGRSSLIVAGGVRLDIGADGRRAFQASLEVWRGDVVDRETPQTIVWRRVSAPPAGPFYRMAASQDGGDRVIFAGGGDNPYNYDGVGYDGVPAHPSGRMFAYSITQDAWTDLGAMPASMDHRGLLAGALGYYVLGGMGEDGVVLNRVSRLPVRGF